MLTTPLMSRARVAAILMVIFALLATVVQPIPANAAAMAVEDNQRATSLSGGRIDSDLPGLADVGDQPSSQTAVLTETSFPLGESIVYDLEVEANTAFRDEQGNPNTAEDQNNEIPRFQREADLVRSRTSALIEISAITSLDGTSTDGTTASGAPAASETCVAATDQNNSGDRIRIDLDGSTNVAAIDLDTSAAVTTTVYVYGGEGNGKVDYTTQGNRILLTKTWTTVKNVFVYTNANVNLVSYCTSLSTGGGTTGGGTTGSNADRSQWLRFQVLEGVVQTFENSDSNQNFNNVNLSDLSFPAPDTEERFNALPPLYVKRNADGNVSEIRRSPNDSAVHVKMSAELLEEFLFRLGGGSDYTVQEQTLQGTQSNQYQLRTSAGAQAGIVVSRQVVNAATGPSETRSQNSKILVNQTGTIASISATETYTNIDEQPTDDWAMPADNRDRIRTSSLSTKAESSLSAEVEGVYNADQQFIDASLNTINNGGLVSETLDAATSADYDEQIKDEGADDLMDQALDQFRQAPEHHETLNLMVLAADAAPQRANELVTAAGSSTPAGAAGVAAALAAASHEPQAEAALASMIGNANLDRAVRVGALMSAAMVPKPTSVLVEAARTFTINESNQNDATITAAVNTPMLVWGALVDQANYGHAQFDSWISSQAASATPGERAALETAANNAGSNVLAQTQTNARLLPDEPTLKDLFDDGGIDWSYSAGTDFASADMHAKLGRFEGGPNGVWIGGTAGLDVTYKDKTTKVFDFALYSGLDLTDEVPDDNFGAFGQIEREFVFRFGAFDKSLIDERKAVKCGIGASGDLLTDHVKNKDGEPLLQWTPKPFDKSFQVGPVTVSVIAQISAGLIAPWSVSADFCDALLRTTTWYDPDVKKNNGGVWPIDYEGRPATEIGQIAFSLGIGGELKGSVGAAVGMPLLRGGIELSGTLFSIQIPIGLSVQIMDKGNTKHLTNGYNFANFDPVVQVCWAGNIETTVLKMSLYAFLEWRLPPLVNRWKRLWEGKVPKNGELFEVPTKPIPLFNSKCSPVGARPLVVVEAPPNEGRFTGPSHNGTPIGTERYAPGVAALALDTYCKNNGYPEGHNTYRTSTAYTTVTYQKVGGSWVIVRPRDTNGQLVETNVVSSVDCRLGSGGGRGQVGSCLSTDSRNWTLLFGGAKGSRVNLSTGKVTAGNGTDAVDLSANTWYRACLDNGAGRRARMAAQLKKEKVNKPDDLTTVFSLMGVTTHQKCIDALVDTPGNFDIDDCGRFVNGSPDVAVSIQLIEQGASTPASPTAASPGPNVGPGTHSINVSLTNNGTTALDDWTATAGDNVTLNCAGDTLAVGATQTCSGTVSALNDGAVSHKIDVAGAYTVPDGNPQTAYSTSSDWYFTNRGVNTQALSVTMEINGTTVNGSVGTASNPVSVDQLVSVTWRIRNNSGHALTDVQMRVNGNLGDDSRNGLCKITDIANNGTGQCQSSFLPDLQNGVATLLASNVTLQAAEGTLTKDVTGYVIYGVTPSTNPAKLQIGTVKTTPVAGTAGVTHQLSADIVNVGQDALTGLKVTSSPLQSLVCPKTTLAGGESTTCTVKFSAAAYQSGQQVTLAANANSVAQVTKKWTMPSVAGGVQITGVTVHGFDGSLTEENPIRQHDYNTIGLKIANTGSSDVNLTFPNDFSITAGNELYIDSSRMECGGNRGPASINVPAGGLAIDCVVDIWLYDNAESADMTATVTVNNQPSTQQIAFVKAPTTLVILGDSFASGEGGRWNGNSLNWRLGREGTDRAWTGFGYDPTLVYGDTYDDNGNNCHRSDVGDIHVTSSVDQRVNLACSGAVTADVRDDVPLTTPNQLKDGSAQVTRLRELNRTGDVTMIVLSIGGNDLNFEPMISACGEAFVYGRPTCNAAQNVALESILDQGMKKLALTIQNIHSAMQDAGNDDYRLVVQGNPSPIGRDNRFSDENQLRTKRGCPFWDEDAAWARDVVTPLLGSSMRQVAVSNDAEFLDLGDLLEGREICSPNTDYGTGANAEWARFIGWGLTQGHKRESMHPNALGQEAIANCINEMYIRVPGNYKCDNKPGQGPSEVNFYRHN